MCTIVAHNIAQNRPDSFPPYPPDNHHCSDDVYLREGGECQPGFMYRPWIYTRWQQATTHTALMVAFQAENQLTQVHLEK